MDCNIDNGFYLKVCLSNVSEYYIKYIDDFSSCIFKNDSLAVVVQAGARSTSSSQHLVSDYLSCDEGSFVPRRTTEGSFVILDSANNRVVVGRDRSQAYHLYLYESGGYLYVSTDVTYLIDVCKELDAVSVDQFICKGIVLAPYPLLKNVKSVMPGYYDVYDNCNPRGLSAFWEIQEVQVPVHYDDAVDLYGDLLLDSVKKNMLQDNVAVFLSGGSDSAAVVGALFKVGGVNVKAIHMGIDGNFEFERSDVKILRNTYGFDLDIVKPYVTDSTWIDYVDESLLNGSLNSLYISFPTYLLMGDALNKYNLKGGTVFNGEMCLLDQGFNEASDSTRNLRRWIYLKGGRILSKSLPIWPKNGISDWDAIRRPYLDRNSFKDKRDVFVSSLVAFMHSIGRPLDFYAGLKFGFRGFPGFWNGVSLLHPDYCFDLYSDFRDSFMNHYLDGLTSKDWMRSIYTMNTCWYSETSNFTMPRDAAAKAKMGVCFPFSSVDLMDYAASLPLEWTVDKKIQKDMCKKFLNMPDEVAYRLKNHRQSFSYFEAVYGSLKTRMVDVVMGTDYGPVDYGIKKLYESGRLSDDKLFALYGLSLWMDKFGLTVV